MPTHIRLGISLSSISNGGSLFPINGFAYPNETLIAPAGTSYQWYVNDIARVTTQTIVLTLNDIGLTVRCVVDGVKSIPVTVWHPRDVSAVKHFWWAESGAFNSLGNNFTDETRSFTTTQPETMTLSRNGSLNGKAAYGDVGTPDSNYCSWSIVNSRWELVISSAYYGELSDFIYYSTENTTYPWQVTTWTGGLNANLQTATQVATTVDTLATDGQTVLYWRDIIGGLNALSTSPNAGLFESTDLDTASIKFDSTDFFTLHSNQRTIFNSQNCCYIFAGAQDTLRTGGDVTHGVVSVNRTSTIPKLGLFTRLNSSNSFAASASSNNSTAVNVVSTSDADYNVLTAEAIFSDGALRLRRNGSQLDSVAVSSTIPNNTTAGSYIGAGASNSTANFNGYMTAIVLAADSTPLSNTNRNHIERFIGLLDSGIDIPLVYPPNTFSATASVVYDTVDGVRLTESSNAIPDYWTSSDSLYTSRITFKSTLTSIGIDAFAASTLDYPLTFPSSLITIGEGAFRDCITITGSLTIPNSVTTIGSNAFYYCYGLTGLTIGNSVTTIGSAAFTNCTGFTGSLVIPNSVTSIEIGAFQGCNSFNGSLTIGNSVNTIGTLAFSGCSGFTGSLTIPNSVTVIGDTSFQLCSGFNGTLTIGNSVTSIESLAFFSCSNFTRININKSVAPTINASAFNGMTGVSPAVIHVPVGATGYAASYSGLTVVKDL